MIKGLALSIVYIVVIFTFSIAISNIFDHIQKLREFVDYAILAAFVAFLVYIVKIGGDSIDK